MIWNRNLSWKGDVRRYEADMTHPKELCDNMVIVERCKAKWPGSERWNYLVADYRDVQLGVTGICHEMAAPTKSNVARVKRFAR